jgi:integrase
MRLGDCIESWLRSKAMRVRPSTATEYASTLAHALPVLGDYYLDAITAWDIEAWFTEQVKVVKPVTANNRLRVLRRCLKDSCAKAGIPNPASFVESVPAGRRRGRGLKPHALRALLDAYNHEDTRPLVLTLAWTGMRWGEASALRWEDIDQTEGTIVVQRAHWQGRVGKTKSGREREVPLHPLLRDALQEHRRRLLARQDPGLEAGWCFATLAVRGPDKGSVKLRNPSSVQKPWARACEKAGVKASPHDLRRTFVDLLRLAEVDAVVEHAIVGHVDDEMRERYSTVRAPEAAAALNKAFQRVMGEES